MARCHRRGEWPIVLEFLRDTDPVLLQRISRKLVNHLSWNGVPEAKELLQRSGIAGPIGAGDSGGENRPLPHDGSLALQADLTPRRFASPATT